MNEFNNSRSFNFCLTISFLGDYKKEFPQIGVVPLESPTFQRKYYFLLIAGCLPKIQTSERTWFHVRYRFGTLQPSILLLVRTQVGRRDL